MKRRIFLALSLCCFLISWLCLFSIKRNADEALASRIAPSILRFHVLANSDSRPDQALKMEVKSLLVEHIRSEMEDCDSKDEMCRYLTSHKDELIALAESYIEKQGFPYQVTLSLSREYFPSRAYGDISFPCGTYDTARVIIGKGKGHNWWCVLYPSLCFIEPSYAVLPDSSAEKLKASMSGDDFQALKDRRPVPHIRFRLLELLGLS